MTKEWFILQLKPNAHHKAVKNLNHQGFETFLPLHDTTTRKASQFIDVTRPLFPGYLFIKFDREKNKWQKINYTYGVSRLITFNSTLKSIPTTIVEDLIKRCDTLGKISPVKKIAVGDKVKVLKGPFANFIASVETYETDHRIWILMELMNRKAKIQVSTEDLELSK
jgi:transcriptional antiterminator RfaH